MRVVSVTLLTVAGALLSTGLLLRSSANVRAESPPGDPLPGSLERLQDGLHAPADASTPHDRVISDQRSPDRERLARGEEAPYRLFVPAAATDTKWTYYETLDPDEPYIERNDFEAIRIAVSDSNINVSLHSASPDGFSFTENNLGWPGRVTVNLVAIAAGTGFIGPSVDVLVTGPTMRIRVVEPPNFRIVFVPWAGEGRVIRFSLSRSIFAAFQTVAYGARGYDATENSNPFCETADCQPVFDGAPDGILDDFSNASTFSP